MSTEGTAWKRCSTCKKPIGFSETWYACSVSTCNRKRIGLFFCSVECFDGHVPDARHRDAWAEKNQSPTRQEYEREQAEEAAALARAETREAAPATAAVRPPPRPVPAAALPREVLVVVSKLKNYVRARSGMNTSDSVVEALSDHLRRLCDRAIANAERDGRRTVMDRDFHGLI
jgi:hypothetical protein